MVHPVLGLRLAAPDVTMTSFHEGSERGPEIDLRLV